MLTTTPVTQTESDSLALTFLEAVLMKDAKALRAYGLDDKMTATIDLETQITVATKLLQSENTKARSTSKRVQAAQVLGTPPPATPSNGTVTPAAPVKAVFHQSVKAAVAAIRTA